MSDKYCWRIDSDGCVVSRKDGHITANELLEKHQKLASNGSYREKHYHEAVEYILAANEIEYNSEYHIIDNIRDQTTGKGNHRKYADIYIPETDTAIELKLDAGTRGLGQVTYYAQHHREAILMSQEHSPYIANATRSVPGVHYATVTPGIHRKPPTLDVMSDSRCEFFHQAKHGSLGGDNWFVKSPEVSGSSGVGSGRERTLSEFEKNGGAHG